MVKYGGAGSTKHAPSWRQSRSKRGLETLRHLGAALWWKDVGDTRVNRDTRASEVLEAREIAEAGCCHGSSSFDVVTVSDKPKSALHQQSNPIMQRTAKLVIIKTLTNEAACTRFNANQNILTCKSMYVTVVAQGTLRTTLRMECFVFLGIYYLQ